MPRSRGRRLYSPHFHAFISRGGEETARTGAYFEQTTSSAALLHSPHLGTPLIDRGRNRSRIATQRARPVLFPVIVSVKRFELRPVANRIAEDESTFIADDLRVVQATGASSQAKRSHAR